MMRASGLFAAGGLLVASWIAWFAQSGPRYGPIPVPAEATGARPSRGHAAFAEDPLASTAPGIPAIPIFAELRDGTPLAAALASRGSWLSIALIEDEPFFATALVPRSPGAVATRRVGELLAGPAAFDPAFLARMPLPPSGAWIALYADGVLLDVRRVDPGRILVRFELDGLELCRALALPLT
jgi:hypothetical protein